MFLVDTSVWVDYFNGRITPETEYLDRAVQAELIQVGDIILTEILQGFRDDHDFERVRHALAAFQQVTLITAELAVPCAMRYRQLRKLGITVRKTIDCIIASYCIERSVALLHADRDFDVYEQQLGLQVIHP